MDPIFRCPRCDEPGYHATTQACLDALAAQIAIERRRLTPPTPTAAAVIRAPIGPVTQICPTCGAWRPRATATEVVRDRAEKTRLRLAARQHWQLLERRRLEGDARRAALVQGRVPPIDPERHR